MGGRLVPTLVKLLVLGGSCVGQEYCRPVPFNPKQASASASEADDGGGDKYLLKIEEVEGPTPRVEQIPGVPAGASPTEFGWVEGAQGGASTRNAKSIELLVSIDSPFHLRVTDRGDVAEVSGRLIKSVVVPARALHIDATGQQPPRVVGEQGEDFRVQVDYTRIEKNGGRAVLTSSVPLRFGKKYLMASGPRLAGAPQAIPQTLWSIEKAKATTAE